jgi:hypothetical protein
LDREVHILSENDLRRSWKKELFVLIEAEDLLGRHIKEFCNPECNLNRRIVLIPLYGVDRPAGDSEISDSDKRNC